MINFTKTIDSVEQTFESASILQVITGNEQQSQTSSNNNSEDTSKRGVES